MLDRYVDCVAYLAFLAEEGVGIGSVELAWNAETIPSITFLWFSNWPLNPVLRSSIRLRLSSNSCLALAMTRVRADPASLRENAHAAML